MHYFFIVTHTTDKSATQPHESLSGCLKEAGNFMGAMVSTILDSPVMGWEG
jgi:hypothetical protein